MRRLLMFLLVAVPLSVFSQTNQWHTLYVTFDDATNGTQNRTASVAAVGENSFVALVTRVQDTADIFNNMTVNYLVGYVNADSGAGRVADPSGGIDVWTDVSTGLDQVTLNGAWQIAGGSTNYVYLANNDLTHNILVFELTATGVVGTDFRMETGSENIFAIDVDTTGYVYVVDYEGSDAKNNELKVYAPIGTPGTTWGDFGGHTDAPVATIDLPPGTYLGVAASGDGSEVYVSERDTKSIMKFVGSPTTGYTMDAGFASAIAPDDIYLDVDGLPVGSTTFLGMDYLDEPGLLFAAVDTFLCSGASVESCGGYNTGRIFVIDPADGAVIDTVDVAQWNLDITGAVDTGSNNGRAGGFASVYDVDVTNEPAVYSQTYYGWAVEKWVFDGDLNLIVSVEQITESIPVDFSLGQNYPNPFNPGTTIEFDVKAAAQVKLIIYNVLGQKVATLVDDRFTPGSYKVSFNASDFPTGIYYYTLQAGSFKQTKKMTLVK